jgi:hypothetical protein
MFLVLNVGKIQIVWKITYIHTWILYPILICELEQEKSEFEKAGFEL